MKFIKIPLLCLLIVFTFSSFAEAQVVCGPDPSTLDFFHVGNSERAKPGDTVNVSVMISNRSNLAALQLYFEYDSTILTPLNYYSDVGIDYYQYDFTGGRMNVTSDTLGGEIIFISHDEDNPLVDSNLVRLKIFINPAYNPQAGELTNVVDSGEGAAFFIPFEVNPNATHNTLTQFPLYSAEVRSEIFPYPVISCLYSRYSDQIGSDIRPTAQIGNFVVDTTDYVCPTINTFTVAPTQIVEGSSATLTWDVVDADSITINNGVGTFTNLSSFVSVTPTSSTNYTLTAYGSCGTPPLATASLTVVAPGSNNIPVVSAVSGAPFTINQGEVVSFSVTATDADASDIITLSAISLPPNAVFNQAVGSGSVTGNFSFTPDFTQSGSFSAVFQATDNAGGSSQLRTVVINVNEIQNDILFSTSAIGQQPVGGLSGKRDIFFPINMVTSEEVYGVQFDFRYDPVFFEVDSFIVTGRTENYVVYDDIGATPGLIKVVTFGLNNEPVVNVVDTTAILYAVMSIDSNATPGDYGIYFENGWESVNPDPDFPSLELVVDSGVIQVDNPGDVNLDKRIDVADLVNVVASIINTYSLSNRQFDVADVITNDTVNVFDLVGIVNLIFGVPLNPNPAPLFEGDKATIDLAYANIVQGGNEMVVVNSETPVDLAAVEVELSYDPNAVELGEPELAADAQGMSIRYNDNKQGNMKILVHFTNPFGDDRIKTGFAEMISIPLTAKEEIIAGNKEQLKVSQAYFSTETSARVEVDGFDGQPIVPNVFALSQNYPNPFNPTTTIEFSLETNKFVNLEIYNILGQHVKNLVDESLPAGAHSVKWDATNQQGGRVASGVYLYRLTVDNNTQSKKMLLLK